ncbi:MAG: DNA methylase [Clostridiales bacterium]|nr:DNA methylase [Clostridiales bacterium]
MYLCIDLKSFYASVECADLGMDPLKTRLVVADEERTDGTICLAVSPALKAYGIPGRPRLFEVRQKVDRIKKETGMDLDFIIAVPRMARYVEVSTKIYSVYLEYIAPEDIHVYSIDEVFIDLTSYTALYKMSAHDLAVRIIRDVLSKTGITATAGIGTNLYLAKIAMDIVAKHCEADRDGVRIAELDEMSYRRLLWNHTPLTDFWRMGHGTAGRLSEHGIYTMGDIARQSLNDEDFFYRLFGIDAELLIDHAWGIETCTMRDIKTYRPKIHSLSSGQVLPRPYRFDEALLVIREMADVLAADLVDRGLVTSSLTIYVGYDRENSGKLEQGDLAHLDHYGRIVPAGAHGSIDLMRHTSSAPEIMDAAGRLFEKEVSRRYTVRRLNITANNTIPADSAGHQIDMFELCGDIIGDGDPSDQAAASNVNDTLLQKTMLDIRKKHGNNAILRGMNLKEGGTARERNRQIGGHRA